jgi:CheY-like chemotaxis protein
VKSEPDKGTEFTVCLPQEDAGSGTLSASLKENLKKFQIPDIMQNKQMRIVRRPMPDGKVLIVDDMETNIYVAKGLLAPYELQIETVLSGFEAIDRVKDGNEYDIIFMDHMMPKMDGMETTKKLREMGYTRPIAALTANAVTGQAEIFLKNGFDDFISKPIDIRVLNTVLNKFISSKKPLDSENPETANKHEHEHEQQAAGANAGNNSGAVNAGGELQKIFKRDAEKAVAELEMLTDFENQEIMQNYIINVHAMKSALANIGKTELSEMASKLEKASRANNISVISNGTPVFLNELHKLIAQLTPKPEDDDKTIAIDEDTVYLREKLIIIKNACTDYDNRTVKSVLAELRQKLWSASTVKILDEIAEHILHSDFEEAADIAERYAEKTK